MKVLLADDHALFREGLRTLLGDLLSEKLHLIEAISHQETIEMLTLHQDISLVLLDLKMPGMDCALPVQSIVSLAGDNTAVLVVSACDSPQIVRETLHQGARGYLPKSADSAMMIQAIEMVLSNQIFMPDCMFKSAQAANGDGKSLTSRQNEVLLLLAQGDSNKKIAFNLNIAERTVKMHVSKLMQIFGAQNRTQIARFAADRPYHEV